MKIRTQHDLDKMVEKIERRKIKMFTGLPHPESYRDHSDLCPCHEDHEDNDKCSCGVVECDCAFKGPKCICDDLETKPDRWGE